MANCTFTCVEKSSKLGNLTFMDCRDICTSTKLYHLPSFFTENKFLILLALISVILICLGLLYLKWRKNRIH